MWGDVGAGNCKCNRLNIPSFWSSFPVMPSSMSSMSSMSSFQASSAVVVLSSLNLSCHPSWLHSQFFLSPLLPLFISVVIICVDLMLSLLLVIYLTARNQLMSIDVILLVLRWPLVQLHRGARFEFQLIPSLWHDIGGFKRDFPPSSFSSAVEMHGL